MKWEILILTQPSRVRFLEQLLRILELQCSGRRDVSIRICGFDERKSLGENREFHRRQTSAEYHNWIDDDDLVTPDYVETILPLLDGADCIGYKVQMYVNEKIGPMAIHSLRCPGWTQVAGWNRKSNVVLQRDIVHLNPMRTELALQFPMEGGRGEDERWARGMKALGIMKTEHFIDRVMHFYMWRKPKLDVRDWSAPWRLNMVRNLERECAAIAR